jgi:hypothetical protein
MAVRNQRTIVTFRSTAFNTSERRAHFINDGCYGDDLARWLMAELAARGTRTDPEPGQEDFGWYFTYHAGVAHHFIVAFRPEPEPHGLWIGWIERRAGLVGSILGARRRAIGGDALATIHAALADSDRVSDVRWHRRTEFERGNESNGTIHPHTL